MEKVKSERMLKVDNIVSLLTSIIPRHELLKNQLLRKISRD